MTGSTLALDSLVVLLNYPEEDYLDYAREAQHGLAISAPKAGEHARSFRNSLEGFSTEELQELFTRTFDLNPACVLEIGWQLYGDEYKRGEFLVRMHQLLAEHHAPDSKELPDHLPRVLDLLPRLGNEEAGELAGNFILPALGKMLASLEGKGNPYQELLMAVQGAVATRYAATGKLEEVKHD